MTGIRSRIDIGFVVMALLGVIACQPAGASSPNVSAVPTDPPASVEVAEAAPTLVGPTGGDEQVHFTVSLNLPDEAALTAFLDS